MKRYRSETQEKKELVQVLSLVYINIQMHARTENRDFTCLLYKYILIDHFVGLQHLLLIVEKQMNLA